MNVLGEQVLNICTPTTERGVILPVANFQVQTTTGLRAAGTDHLPNRGVDSVAV